MKVIIELINACSDTMLPAQQDFQIWTETALAALASTQGSALPKKNELSIRVIDEAESASLNENYRQKQGPTNILSFPYSGIPGTGINLLGDLAICSPLVRKEATEQEKTIQAHWAHLTIHGVLHLKGYDHEDYSTAEQMESLEITIMETLGYTNPYQELKGDE